MAQADDYGPDVCVEAAAGGPILDASPLVALELYGVHAAGWSQQLPVLVRQVDDTAPLGPCALPVNAPEPEPASSSGSWSGSSRG